MSVATPVSATNVSKRFGPREVLSNITVEVPPGGFLSIVGRSGCGKSTLLRLLVGLDQPTGGTITAPFADARLVFQEPRLLPWASCRDNVMVGLGATASGPAAQAAATEALTRVGLGDRGGQWPSALSGGQRQRVALARALVSRPGFLALDEPFGALDALTRIEMQGLLEGVWREQGFSAVLVTHDVSEAVLMGDRVVLIEAGKIALDLTIDLPRPRAHGHPTLVAAERQILDQLFGKS